jgi:hypothetical protein
VRAGATLEVRLKPEIRAASATAAPPDCPPAAIGLLPGGQRRGEVAEAGMHGQHWARNMRLGDKVHRHTPSLKIKGQRDMFVCNQPPEI